MASPNAESPASAGDASSAPTPSPRRAWLRWLVVAATVLAVYAALGFLLAPRLLRNAIQEKGTAALHRQVTVAEVKVNPSPSRSRSAASR